MKKTPATLLATTATLLIGATSVAVAPTAAWAGTKPSCVKVSVRESSSAPFYSKEIASVHNGCRTTKHLKVVWHAGKDSSCMRVLPGRTVRSQAQLTVSHYDRTVTC